MSILIEMNTKVICQGFTGKNGTFHCVRASADDLDDAAQKIVKAVKELRK
jgi:succinyl-CoA synthetase alpha subunit